MEHRPGLAEAAMLTPMMAQYLEIRAANPSALLFYRMGDFYELFFKDAEVASAALGIVLTHRGKHLGEDIPMCGVPVHAAQDYLSKLIGLGHRVAICEQVEDPAEARKRGAKAVVRRDVVRLVTPGTLTEDELLPARGARLLAALAILGKAEPEFALAWADVSTGETAVLALPEGELGDELARIDPAELLVTARTAEWLTDKRLLSGRLRDGLTPVDGMLFDSEAAVRHLAEAYSADRVDPYAFNRAERAALGALIAYVGSNNRGSGHALRPPGRDGAVAAMAIDAATRSSLELLETQRGTRDGSLLGVLDSCATACGSRLLARRLAAPLAERAPIERRLDAVGALLADGLRRDGIRSTLRGAPDLGRALTRLALGRGGPRDLRAVGAAIATARALSEVLQGLEDAAPLAAVLAGLGAAPAGLGDELARAIDDAPPLLGREGGFVREAFSSELDEVRRLGSETRTVVAALQARLAGETGLKSLKVRHNGVLGFFLEVPAGQGARLLDPGSAFIHRQTLANVMRFTTPELAELEGRIARAQDEALQIELRIFDALRDAVLAATENLRRVADALAEIDVLAGLANVAATRRWCRPALEAGLAFEVRGGRHPVVEAHVRAAGGSFVANDAVLTATGVGEAPEAGAIWLLTGPNMGGKSTFLRQNALIAILAQMGSFVPAESARLGLVDRVFSRVGAADDIGGGRSTFMVEMVETAAILNRATRRSLVILDEIGRGTATFDGLSIAWATVEALHETVGCRALFATHFHELTALARRLQRLSNHTMKVREWEGEVVFLHEVGEGAADRSYGIQVARLAGLPEPVLARAREVLSGLEMRSSGSPTAVLDDLPLFSHRPAPPAQPQADPLVSLIDAARPDELTPRQALDLLYELKKLRNASRRT